MFVLEVWLHAYGGRGRKNVPGKSGKRHGGLTREKEHSTKRSGSQRGTKRPIAAPTVRTTPHDRRQPGRQARLASTAAAETYREARKRS
eukprot:6080716-Pleurochrysis_carterae.AAC.1